MKVPEGLSVHLNIEYNEEDCVILDKSIYGLVQAARQFHRKLISVLMKEMKFKKCAEDECLLLREDESGTIVICVYIDDTLCAGPKKALAIFKTELTLWFPGAVNVAFLATKTACVNKCCQKGNKNGFTSRFY